MEYDKALKTVAKGAGIVLLGMIIGSLFDYLTTIFLARGLGPEGYGLISICTAILGILSVISVLGLQQGATRQISYYSKDEAKVKWIISRSLAITLPISIITAVLLFIFSQQISIEVFHDSLLSPVMQVFAVMIPFVAISLLLKAYFRGFKMAVQNAISEHFTENGAKLALVLLVLSMGYGTIGAAWAILAAYILSVAVGLFLIRKKLRKIISLHSVSRVPLLSFSLPLMITGIIVIIIRWTDVFMIGVLSTSSQAGIYNAALSTAMWLLIFLMSTGFLFMPVSTEFHSRERKKELKSIYSSVARWIFILTLPFFLILLLFPDVILKVLFGTEYIAASLTLSVLSVGFFFGAAAGLTNVTLISIGMPKKVLTIESVMVILNVLLNALLIPVYGILGAAVASTAALLAGNSIALYYLKKHALIQPFTANHLKILFAGLVAVTAMFGLHTYVFPMRGIPALLVALALFFMLYASLVLVLRAFKPDDFTILRAIEKRLGFKMPFRGIVKRFAS